MSVLIHSYATYFSRLTSDKSLEDLAKTADTLLEYTPDQPISAVETRPSASIDEVTQLRQEVDAPRLQLRRREPNNSERHLLVSSTFRQTGQKLSTAMPIPEAV